MKHLGNPIGPLGLIFLSSFLISSCSSSSSSSGSDSGDTAVDCTTFQDNVTVVSTNSNGCELLSRDTSSCQATREAAGLSGFWLEFSCDVTLSVSGSNVYVATENLPDYDTYYFGESSACYTDFDVSGRNPNPGTLTDISATIEIPMAGAENTGTKTDTELGAVGVAVNGVLIFNNEAGPGDNIYDEVSTFDQCDGHPAQTHYHYHIEPPAISDSDSNLIGVMRDGYPVYGKYESGTTEPSDLDTYGGHTGPLHHDSSETGYHYHMNSVSGTDGSGASTSAYFLKADAYYGTPGTSCTNCLPQ